MEKKPKICAVLKIEASVSIIQQNKNLKMTILIANITEVIYETMYYSQFFL